MAGSCGIEEGKLSGRVPIRSRKSPKAPVSRSVATVEGWWKTELDAWGRNLGPSSTCHVTASENSVLHGPAFEIYRLER